MRDGFIRVAAATPALQVASCAANAQNIISVAKAAAEKQVRLLVTPELGVCGATCGDLFLQPSLLDAAEAALRTICEQTATLEMLLVVGLPLRHRGKLYNCAAVLNQGHVLGLVPKSYPPNYGEFYELRHFSPAFGGIERFEAGFLRGVPIGTELLFRCDTLPTLNLGVEIGQDLWVPAPPSIFHMAAGATVIANLSASSEAVGQAEWRRDLVRSHSGRLVCAYLYVGAGTGESTTDAVFAGHNLIAQNGHLLAEAAPFSGDMAVCELDLQQLTQERLRNTAFPDAGGEGYLTIGFTLPQAETTLSRPVSPTPFIPADEAQLAQHCETVLAIQAAGLRKRLEHTGAKTAVVGVSGGLDSALALLVTVRAFEAMGRPAADIIAVTLPAFGTTGHTLGNAKKLCQALGVPLQTVNISATVEQHFQDIGHSAATTDLVYENAQARVRTLTLMDIANQHGGLVVGTGDLSELALGWATFNGDHMSMYGVNASVPKTLLRCILAHLAATHPPLQPVLQAILATPVSPELLPAKDGEITQQTEELIGPYELHDFFLYYFLRWNFTPGKIYRLARLAFAGKYNDATLLKWLRVFTTRFFAQQFKRNCLPDGPKVGTVSLSPRGGWRMPSDAVATAWLQELDTLQP